MDWLNIIDNRRTLMRKIMGKPMVMDIIAVIQLPEEREGSKEHSIEEGRMKERRKKTTIHAFYQ